MRASAAVFCRKTAFMSASARTASGISASGTPICVRTSVYFGTEYPDFPLPRLVFGFRVSQEGKVLDCRLGVVEDKPPAEDSAMFVYPFSNVGGFHLCTGNNVLPVYKKTSALVNLPGYLLQLPNNNDSFNPQNNKLHMPYRELLNHLKDKDPSYYYTDVLVPSGKTLKDFIE